MVAFHICTYVNMHIYVRTYLKQMYVNSYRHIHTCLNSNGQFD